MLPISVENLHIARNGEPLFQDFSFDTRHYRRIGIMGSTGAGKTTLLKMLAGFIQPDSGNIFIDDQRVLGPNEQLIAGHHLIGYLSQHYELRNNYYVNELLEMANKLTHDRKDEVIELCQIRHLLNRRTDALSGGERQRIALARVLLTDAKWLLLDEPYSNLDLNQKRSIMELINNVGEKLDVSFIMVSHDATDMLSWADHLIIIDQGKIIQQAEPKQLYDYPLNEHIAGLLGEYNVCDASLVQQLTNTSSPLAKGEKYLIRPENIYITKEVRGVGITIEKVYFKGSYSLLNCRLDNHELSIIISATGFQNFKIGESFYINTSMNQVVVVG